MCDILNNTFSPIANNGGVNSIHHNIGKIGDHNIYLDFNVATLLAQLKDFQYTDVWFGTHCWLGSQDLSNFNQVINITTVTYKSRLYRWIRAYHHYYSNSQPWQHLQGMQEIDKQRETAKDYIPAFLPVNHNRVKNIEFADVVECQTSFIDLLPKHYHIHVERWQSINSFLYQPNVWQSTAATRFYEAEYEVLSNQSYCYS
jgi:hypothetical protein